MRRVVVLIAALALGLFYGPRAFATSGDVAGCPSVDDLVIGVPEEDLGQDKTGVVNVVPGVQGFPMDEASADGWSQDSTDVNDSNEAFDAIGAAVVVGDFDNDGCDDLAFGVPREDVSGVSNAGAVNVIYNDGGNLDASPAANPPPNDQFWMQSSPGVPGTISSGDAFGATLAVGDFDGNGVEDLAIGVPGDLIGTKDGAGSVNILYGSDDTGLTTSGAQLWSQNSTGVIGGSEPNDHLGAALGVGFFDGNASSDLAIGVPDEDVGTKTDAGQVNVLYGSSGGITGTGDEIWNQDVSGIEGTAEAGDHFGAAATSGDFDAVEPKDLAIGVPGEAIGTLSNAGAVNVIYSGGSGGLSASGDQFWHENQTGVEGTSEAGDVFGAALASADFDKANGDDLAIGAPGENSGRGQVHVLFSGSGLQASDDIRFDQDTTGVEGTAATGDHFGLALVTGDYNGDTYADLAVGAPDDDETETTDVFRTDAGVVDVIFDVPDPGDVTQLITQDGMSLTTDEGNGSESGDRFGFALG